MSHVFCTRYHFSICFTFYVRKEHFWVVINVLWISKDIIYNNKSEICNGSFRFDFYFLIIYFTLMCFFQPQQGTVSGKGELCPMSVPMLRVSYIHKSSWSPSGTCSISLAIMREWTISSLVTPSCRCLNLVLSDWRCFHQLLLMVLWGIKHLTRVDNKIN